MDEKTTTAEPKRTYHQAGCPGAPCSGCALPRGFAAMDPARQRELASRGGKRAHETGKGHQWDAASASIAGKRGGMASRGGRGKLPPPEKTDE